MPFCTKCGFHLSLGLNYCPCCGEKIEKLSRRSLEDLTLEELKRKFNGFRIPWRSMYPRGEQVNWENFVNELNDELIEFIDYISNDESVSSFEILENLEKVNEMAYALTRLGRKSSTTIIVDKMVSPVFINRLLDGIDESGRIYRIAHVCELINWLWSYESSPSENLMNNTVQWHTRLIDILEKIQATPQEKCGPKLWLISAIDYSDREKAKEHFLKIDKTQIPPTSGIVKLQELYTQLSKVLLK